MSKKEKITVERCVFLTVIATSAITTIIISPSRAVASYSSPSFEDLVSRVERLEASQRDDSRDIHMLYRVTDGLKKDTQFLYEMMEETGIVDKMLQKMTK